MVKNILKAPGGMRSYLPGLAAELREIQEKIDRIFRLWGYQPIITPTLEYYDALTAGMGEGLKKELYKFIDYEGNILALRPEMTAPIARTIAGRIGELKLPERFSYNASVFRYDQPQAGKNREIFQMGVELIGAGDTLADAEAVILAIESLEEAGLAEFKIDIGHAGFVEGIIGELFLGEMAVRRIKSFLIRRDLVGLRSFLESLGISEDENIFALPLLRGGREVLEKAAELAANEPAQEAVANLQGIEHFLSEYGLNGYINYDLGLIRGFDYYTGVVFEAFTDKLGYTICGGGRYDNLINSYCGRSEPAIGFAIGVERVRLALEKEGYRFREDEPEIALLFNQMTAEAALELARTLRQRGIVTLLSSAEELTPGLLELYRRKGVKKIISFSPRAAGEVVLTELGREQEAEGERGLEREAEAAGFAADADIVKAGFEVGSEAGSEAYRQRRIVLREGWEEEIWER